MGGGGGGGGLRRWGGGSWEAELLLRGPWFGFTCRFKRLQLHFTRVLVKEDGCARVGCDAFSDWPAVDGGGGVGGGGN